MKEHYGKNIFPPISVLSLGTEKDSSDCERRLYWVTDLVRKEQRYEGSCPLNALNTKVYKKSLLNIRRARINNCVISVQMEICRVNRVFPISCTVLQKKVFSQPPIVQVLPLKKMREACNFHHRYTSTMTDKMRTKNPENHIVGFFMNLFANYGGK